MSEAKLGMSLAEFQKLESAHGFERKESFGGGHDWIPRIEMTKYFSGSGVSTITLYFGATGSQTLYKTETQFQSEQDAMDAALEVFGAQNDGTQWKFVQSKERYFVAWVYGPYLVILLPTDETEIKPSARMPIPRSQDLAEAVDNGNLVRVIEILKAHPELVNQADEMHGTLLHRAANAGFNIDFDIVEVKPYTEIVEYLLVKGADPNRRDILGNTPLHQAIFHDAPRELIEALLKGGADPTLGDNGGETPWQTAERSTDQERRDMLRVLLDNPKFLVAAEDGIFESVKIRLDSDRALIESRNPEGLTALHLACLCGSPQDSEGATLRDSERYLPIVETLLARGIDPNVRVEKTGVTPLHLACKMGSVPIVRTLLEAGADPESEDEEGRYPADYVGRTIITQPVADQLWKLLGEKGTAPTNRLPTEEILNLCESNLKSLVVMTTLYQRSRNELPEGLELLIPNYLPELPKCYASPDSQYTLEMQGAEFVIRCSEKHGLPERPSHSSAD
jgi:ankyrin repeat protein